jgi:hypothetical protein
MCFSGGFVWNMFYCDRYLASYAQNMQSTVL